MTLVDIDLCNIGGGLLIGVESRLATLTTDADDLKKLSVVSNRSDLPSTFQPRDIAQLATTLPALFNTLNVRRAIIPAANGHCSARALARYYAALVDGGKVPPPHSSSSKPALGSHPHLPKFASLKPPKQQKGYWRKLMTSANCTETHGRMQKKSYSSGDSSYSMIPDNDNIGDSNNLTAETTIAADDPQSVSKIFSNPRIHDAFMGAGEYENLVLPGGKFGLGFRRCYAKDGSLIGFGHSGMGGSTGYCDIKNRFAISVTLNKMSFGAVTGKIVHLVCSELGIPVPEEYSRFGEGGADMQMNLEKPLIN